MIIAPLVFTTLIGGIAHMEDAATVGRVGAKTLGWFISASIVSLLIGLGMVHLLQPGAGLSLPPPDVTSHASGVETAAFTLKDFLTHVVPTVSTQGIGILATYAKFVGGFYLSMGLLWCVLVLAGFLVIGPRVRALVATAWRPALLAFSTASSEAAYPRLLEGLQAFGLPRKIVSFVLPLGYSFNLDGSMMYCTFATLFIAQVYGVHMSVGQQVTMLLLLMVTSKGMAGVPRASLVVIMATLSFFKLPEAGIYLILGVDHLLDMGRSATNVVGNSVAAAVVGKWEGQLGVPDPEATLAEAVKSEPAPVA
jgi:Na+/H+-dicarboxylate symporter